MIVLLECGHVFEKNTKQNIIFQSNLLSKRQTGIRTCLKKPKHDYLVRSSHLPSTYYLHSKSFSSSYVNTFPSRQNKKTPIVSCNIRLYTRLKVQLYMYSSNAGQEKKFLQPHKTNNPHVLNHQHTEIWNTALTTVHVHGNYNHINVDNNNFVVNKDY